MAPWAQRGSCGSPRPPPRGRGKAVSPEERWPVSRGCSLGPSLPGLGRLSQPDVPMCSQSPRATWSPRGPGSSGLR